MPGLLRRGTFSGVATFNSYGAQGNTVCGPKSGTAGTYAAAAGDLSPNISGGRCSGTVDDMSLCAGQSPVSGYTGPSCPKSNCGICYRVTNQGGYGGSHIGGVGNTIVVQIVDSCPASHAMNYCKTDVPGDQRCAPGTNSLDIDQSAYMALTGQPFGGGPNIRIGITPVSCP
ncbi:hypothetical protein MMC16_006882 [Acarospora aff. strigata]|nr:hypothetical protein [Acarospora aff. strigata]